jgi:hypothetical protein
LPSLGTQLSALRTALRRLYDFRPKRLRGINRHKLSILASGLRGVAHGCESVDANGISDVQGFLRDVTGNVSVLTPERRALELTLS